MTALLRKEWREHRAALAIVLLLCLGMALIELRMASDAISPLMAWHGLVVHFGVLAAVFVANRLVLREYGAGTQLFLETLPVSRVAVILVKWCMGCLWLLLALACAYALILFEAREAVPLDPLFVTAMGLRALAFLLLVYGVAFVVALTLNLRYYVWGLLLVAAIMLDQTLQLPLGDWAPFYLIKQTMVLERQLPALQLAITLALAAAVFAAALALVLLARGALVTALARRPSARTQTVMVLLFMLGFWAMTLLAPKVEPPPVELANAVVSDAGPVAPRVKIGWRRDIGGIGAAQAANTMARDLAALQAWLALPRLADTLLVADGWSEPDEFKLGHGAPGQVVVRAALGDPALSLHDLMAMMGTVQVLDQAPAYRWREDRFWLLPGLAAWRQARHNPAYAALLERRAQVAAAWLRRGAAGQDSPLEAVLRQGAFTNERLGDCLNTALGARAVQLLADSLGEARLRDMMRQAFAPQQDDLAGMLRTRSLDRLLEEAGLPLPTLAARLDAALAPAITPPASPRLTVQALALDGHLAELHYRLDQGPPGERVTINYLPLRPGEVRAWIEQAASAPARASGVLPATFVRGQHVLVYGKAWDPALGCHVHFGAVHQELP